MIRKLLVLLVLLSACASTPPQQTLTIFAAASLSEVFQELGTQFMLDHPGSELVFNFAGSQQLSQQLLNGAPADVYAAAHLQQMEQVVAAGLIDRAEVMPFTGNSLVLVLPQANPAQITELADLARPGLRLVLAAEEVPAGRYARTMLQQAAALYGADFSDHVLSNVMSNEQNVRAVLTKVELGEADAGIVYASDPGRSALVQTLPIAPEFNVQAVYLIAPLQATAQSELAEAWVAWVQEPEAQTILQRYGFEAPVGAP